MSKISKIIKSMEDLTSDICLISYEIFNIDDCYNRPIIQLLCGHTFYYDNIIQSYLITNKNQTLNCKRMCPYCRCNGGYLPFISGEYHKGIHLRPAVSKITMVCGAILQSGKNKGKICGCKAPSNSYKLVDDTKIHLCGRHKCI